MLNGWSVHGFLSRRMAEHSPPMVEEVKLYEVATVYQGYIVVRSEVNKIGIYI